MTLQLNFKHEGEGPSLLLIHGLFGSLENLGVLFRELVEDFSVYSIDLPEHGRSPHHAETSLPALCEQVKTWLDQQGIERIAVVGHSLGGKVAMELKNLAKGPEGYHWRMNLEVLYRDYAKLIQGNSSGNYEGPALFLRGGSSNYIQEANHSEIYQRFPNAQIESLPGMGHWLHAENPKAVLALLRPFLSGA